MNDKGIVLETNVILTTKSNYNFIESNTTFYQSDRDFFRCKYEFALTVNLFSDVLSVMKS